MRRVSTLAMMLVGACVELSNDPVSPDAGSDTDVPESATTTSARSIPRMFGIDVQPASGEAYADALSKARASGTTFVPLMLPWTVLEAGPDDPFSHTVIDTKKWDVTGAFFADGTSKVVGYVTTAPTPAGNLRTRYKLGAGPISAEVSATLASGDETQATMIMRFGTGDKEGSRCALGTDQFAALVLTRSWYGVTLAAATCRNGLFRTDWMITAKAADKLRITRTASQLVFQSSNATVLAINLSSLPSAFRDPGRVALFAGNPTGAATVALTGFRVTGPVTWDNANDRFVGDPGFDLMAAIASTHGPLQTPLVITLATINTVRSELPSDLNVNDPATGKVDLSRYDVRTRYRAAFEYMLARLPNIPIVGFAVGNEVDGYLTNDTSWAQAQVFADDLLTYIQYRLGAGTPVGMTVTSFGLRSDPRIAALERSANVLFVTYYPLDGQFAARDPGVVQGDVSAVLAATTKPVLFIEAGYPSASASASCPLCSGSEAKQAEFFRQMFSAWDAHADRIRGFSVSWMTDPQAANLEIWKAYYGVSTPAFVAYLATLGVRSAAGVPKPAWTTIGLEAHARGF